MQVHIAKTIMTRMVEMNMADVRIEFLNKNGEPLKEGEQADESMFVVVAEGIDPLKVYSVEFPKLCYRSTDPALVKIEMLV